MLQSNPLCQYRGDPESVQARCRQLRPRCRVLCRCSFLSALILLFILALRVHVRDGLQHGRASSGRVATATVGAGSSGGARRPPRVDRAILDKLWSLEQSLASPTGHALTEPDRRRLLPPKVTRLPEEGAAPPTHSRLERDPALDAELCGTAPCRLLLPSFIGEQESKARRHLLQLSQLARALNRTLVLPNVGKSRMGSCAKWDFGFYYETADVHETATFGAFRRWVALRASQPKAQVVEILPALSDSERDSGITLDSSNIPELEHARVIIAPSANPSRTTHNHCLQSRARNLHFGRFSPLHIRPRSDLRDAWERNHDGSLRFGRGVMAALSSQEVAKASVKTKTPQSLTANEPDVLVVSWELRHPIFPTSDVALRYAERWTKLAESLSHRLQPFVAVHWRMERVPGSQLSACVPLLVSSIASLLRQHDKTGEFTSVYLATDYPTEGPDRRHSGTFEVGAEHHRAMLLFEAAFKKDGKLSGVRLTSLVQELRQGGLVREDFSPDDLDPGLMGIVDKLVSSSAALFLGGGPRCGKVSSFTAQIVEDRRRAQSSLLNVVEHFG